MEVEVVGWSVYINRKQKRNGRDYPEDVSELSIELSAEEVKRVRDAILNAVLTGD